MNVATVNLPTSANNLKALIGDRAPQEAQILIVQCPSANAGICYFGDSANQIFELAAGDPFYYVPGEFEGGRINLSELYFKGSSGDKLSVMWVEYGKSD